MTLTTSSCLWEECPYGVVWWSVQRQVWFAYVFVRVCLLHCVLCISTHASCSLYCLRLYDRAWHVAYHTLPIALYLFPIVAMIAYRLVHVAYRLLTAYACVPWVACSNLASHRGRFRKHQHVTSGCMFIVPVKHICHFERIFPSQARSGTTGWF